MTGLLYKEFYTLRRYMTSYASAFLIFVVLSVIMKSGFYLQSMLTMSIGMVTLTGMSYDKMYGWDKMVLTTSLKRSQIVLSKYIANAITGIVSLNLSTVLSILISKILKIEDEPAEMMLITGVILFAILMIIYSVLLPLIYKFGVERTRIYMAGVVALLLLGFVTFEDHIPVSVLGFIEEHVIFTGVLLIGLAAVCYIVSYCISVRIYEKQEF